MSYFWVWAKRAAERIDSAQRIEARSDETLQAAQPERREPGPKDAPNIMTGGSNV